MTADPALLRSLQPAQRQQVLRQVGRARGNQSVEALVRQARRPSLHRGVLQRIRRQDDDGGGSPPALYEEALGMISLEEAAAMDRRMDLRYRRASQYVGTTLSAVDAVRADLRLISARYNNAYQSYSNIIGAGRAEAQNQTMWRNVAVGIGIGIALGVAAAWIFPVAEAGAFAISAGELLTAAGSAGGQAAAGGLLAAGVAGLVETPGSNLQPTGLDPDVLNTRIWQGLAARYRHAAQMNRQLQEYYGLTRNASAFWANLRVRRAGGEIPATPRRMIDTWTRLVEADRTLESGFDQTIQREIQRMEQLQRRANAGLPESYGQREMERDIWVLWIASLDPNDEDSHDILDLDEIEDYLHGSINILGRGSILGVDFGDYTSEDDERAAVRAARTRRQQIQARFRQLSGSGGQGGEGGG